MVKLTLFGKIAIAVALFLIVFYVVLPAVFNPMPSQNWVSILFPNPAGTIPVPPAPDTLEVIVYVSPFEPSSLQLLNTFKELSQEKELVGKFSYRAIDIDQAPNAQQQFPSSQAPFFVIGNRAYDEKEIDSIRLVIQNVV